jgi:hypothetical protein
MFGEPVGEQSIRFPDGVRWGWYQEIAFTGPDSYIFNMYIGAGQYNDNNEGTFAGQVTVQVEECGSGESSSVDWQNLFDDKSGICGLAPEEQRHVHIGGQLPSKNKKGGVTFAPGKYTMGCCEIDKPCFVIVHASVSDFHEAECFKCDNL